MKKSSIVGNRGKIKSQSFSSTRPINVSSSMKNIIPSLPIGTNSSNFPLIYSPRENEVRKPSQDSFRSIYSKNQSDESKSTKRKGVKLERIFKKTSSLISDIFYTERTREDGVVHTEPDSRNHLFTEFVENSDLTDTLCGPSSKNRCLSIPDLSLMSERISYQTASRKHSLKNLATLLKNHPTPRKQIVYPNQTTRRNSSLNLDQGEDSKVITSSETSIRKLYDPQDKIKDLSIERGFQEGTTLKIARKANRLVLDGLSQFRFEDSQNRMFLGSTSGSRTQRLREKMSSSKSVVQPISSTEFMAQLSNRELVLKTEESENNEIYEPKPRVPIVSPIKEEENESPKIEKKAEVQKQSSTLKNLLKIRRSLRTKTFNLSDQTRLDFISNDEDQYKKNLIFKNLTIKPNKSTPEKNVDVNESLVSEPEVEAVEPKQFKPRKYGASAIFSRERENYTDLCYKGVLYQQLKDLHKVHGEIVSPKLRSRPRRLTFEKETQKENKMAKFKFEIQKKLKHNKSTQIGVSSFVVEDEHEFSKTLEKGFLKSFNQTLNNTKKEASKGKTNIISSCVEQARDIGTTGTLLSFSSMQERATASGQDFSRFIHRFESLPSILDLGSSHQEEKKETIVIKIRPAYKSYDKMTFSIQEEFSDLEESNASMTPNLTPKKEAYPLYSYTIYNHNKDDTMCETLNKSKMISGGRNEGKIIFNDIEDMFKFDEIDPSYLANLKVKSQRLRIKSNFFSFVENLCTNQNEEDLKNFDYLTQLIPLPENPYLVKSATTKKTFFDLSLRFVQDFDENDISNFSKIISQEENQCEQEEMENRDENPLMPLAFEPHKIIPRLLFRGQKDTKPSRGFIKNGLLTYLKSSEIYEIMKKGSRLDLKNFSLKLGTQEDFSEKQSLILKLLKQSKNENLQLMGNLIFDAYRPLLSGPFEHCMKIKCHEKQELKKENQENIQNPPIKKALRRYLTKGKCFYQAISKINQELAPKIILTPNEGSENTSRQPAKSMIKPLKTFIQTTSVKSNIRKKKRPLTMIELSLPKNENHHPNTTAMKSPESSQSKETGETRNYGMNRFFKFPSNKLDISIEEQSSNKDLLNVSTNHSLFFLSPPKLASLPQVQSQPFIKIDQQEKTNFKESLAKSILKSQVKTMTEISQSKVTENKALGRSKNVVIIQPKINHNMNKKKEGQEFGTNIVEDLFKSVYQNRLVQILAITQVHSKDFGRFLDKEGNTPLMIASKIGNFEAVKLLINEYTDLNAQNNDGDTALHLAIAYLNDQIADFLIKCGAKQGIINIYGQTPWEVAPN